MSPDDPLSRWRTFLSSPRGPSWAKMTGALVLICLITTYVAWPTENADFSLAVDWPDTVSNEAGVTLSVWTPQRADKRTYRVWMGDSSTPAHELLDAAPTVQTSPSEASTSLIALPAAKTDNAQIVVVEAQTEDGARSIQKAIIPQRSPVRLGLQTDRPLYMPGQRIRSRLIATDSHSGQPARGREVEITITDPKGLLIFSSTQTTSQTGVAHVQVPLIDTAEQGAYTVSASSGTSTAHTEVEVRPYRLPNFEVELEASDGNPSGQPMKIVARAHYFYGAPVAGAEVRVELRDDQHRHVVSQRGKTDDSGAFVTTLEPAADLLTGLVVAEVTSDGRRESTSANVVFGTRVQVDVVAAWSSTFHARQSNPGYFVVRGPDRRPLEGATVVATLPESGSHREVSATTDGDGHASFTWTPPYTPPPFEVRVEHEGTEVFRRVLKVPVERSPLLQVRGAVFTEGEPITVHVEKARSKQRIVARNRGQSVWTATVEAGEGIARLDAKLEPGTLGLTHFELSHYSSVSQAVWITRAETTHLTTTVEPHVVSPGRHATLSANLDTGARTHFAIAAVDEALYALLDRSDVPFGILMRHDVETGRHVERALAAHSTFQTPAIAASKFQESANLIDRPPRIRGADITRTVRIEEERQLLSFWAIVLFLMALGSVAMSARCTLQIFSNQIWSFRRLIAIFGSGVVHAAILFALLAMSSGDPSAAVGGLVVWVLGVVAACLGAATRNPQAPVVEWLGWNISAAALLMGAFLTIADLGSTWIAEALGYPAVIGALIALFVGILVWTLALYHRREFVAAFGLGSLLAPPVLLVFTVYGMQGGRDFKTSMDTRPAAMESEAATAGQPPPPQEEAPSGQDQDDPRVRSWFPETMIWLPEVTAEDGKLEHRFEVPDSITTWRINTWAHTDDGQFTESQTQLVAHQPVFVEVEVPQNLIVGDSLQIPVRIVNDSDSEVSLSLSARTTGGMRYEGGLPGSVTIAAGSRTSEVARIRATSSGHGTLEVQAGDREAGDAIRRSVSIAPNGRELAATNAAFIGDGARFEVRVPDAAIDGTATVRAAIYPGILSEALVGLESMLREPTGCFEQTSSANYPNVLVLRELERTPPEDWPTEFGKSAEQSWRNAHRKAVDLVALGYQRMMRFQTDSGGFALYPNRTPDPMLTAYGILQLNEMKQVYDGVDERAVEHALRWLSSVQNRDGSWPTYAAGAAGGRTQGDDIGQLRSTAFVALAMLESDSNSSTSATQKALDLIEKRIGSTNSPHTLALAALALHAAERESARQVVDSLTGTVASEGELRFWPAQHPTWIGAREQFADIETTALATVALLKTKAAGPITMGALNFLAKNRSPQGGWGTTQATAWTLRAFAEMPGSKNDGAVEVRFNGQAMPAEGDGVDGAVLSVQGPQPAAFFKASLDTSEPGVIELKPTASSASLAAATTTWWQRWDELPSEESPLSVDVNAPATGQVGTEMTLDVTLTNTTEVDLSTSILELPLLPGSAINDAIFEALLNDPLVDRFERTPTHVRLYLSGLPARQHKTFSYRITPLLAGQMTLSTARAWRYYTPTPRSESGGLRVTVRP